MATMGLDVIRREIDGFGTLAVSEEIEVHHEEGEPIFLNMIVEVKASHADAIRRVVAAATGLTRGGWINIQPDDVVEITIDLGYRERTIADCTSQAIGFIDTLAMSLWQERVADADRDDEVELCYAEKDSRVRYWYTERV